MQRYFNWWMKKQMAHLHNKILISNEKEQIIAAGNTLNGSQGHYAEWKGQSQQVTYCMIPCVGPSWNDKIIQLDRDWWCQGTGSGCRVDRTISGQHEKAVSWHVTSVSCVWWWSWDLHVMGGRWSKEHQTHIRSMQTPYFPFGDTNM